MLFKKKCRHCGTNNPKGSVACTRCSHVFFSQEVEAQLKHREMPVPPKPMKVIREKVETPKGNVDMLDRFMKTMGVNLEEVITTEEIECTCMECNAVFPVGDESEVICPKCGAVLELDTDEIECTCMECNAVFPADDEDEVTCPKCGAILELDEE